MKPAQITSVERIAISSSEGAERWPRSCRPAPNWRRTCQRELQRALRRSIHRHPYQPDGFPFVQPHNQLVVQRIHGDRISGAELAWLTVPRRDCPHRAGSGVIDALAAWERRNTVDLAAPGAIQTPEDGSISCGCHGYGLIRALADEEGYLPESEQRSRRSLRRIRFDRRAAGRSMCRRPQRSARPAAGRGEPHDLLRTLPLIGVDRTIGSYAGDGGSSGMNQAGTEN
jgi:hypothetical protein